ncbi:MAG: hypothetical protein AB7D06_05600 [Pedobacter sp.]
MKNGIILLLCFCLTACGGLNSKLANKTKQVEYYRIFDIQTDVERTSIIDAASRGLGRNAGDAREATPIPSFSTPPEQPGRFKVVNQMDTLNGSEFGRSIGALAAISAGMGGGSLGLKSAQCDGAVWTANATKSADRNFNLNLVTCLFEYKGGYHLDMYAHLTKQEGGMLQLSRAMASALVGTPEEWVEKTFLDVVRQIHNDTNAEIEFLEGYPKMQGTPWLDSGETFTAKN